MLQKQNSISVLRKGVLKTCSKFTGEHPCRNVTLIKLLSNFIEITLRHKCSPVNLLYIFRITFSENTYRGLLLTLGRILIAPLKYRVFLTQKIYTFYLSVAAARRRSM